MSDVHRFRVVPRQPVYLSAPREGGERFARLFTETWRRLPLGVRRRILGYWRTDLYAFPPSTPSIELLADWPHRQAGPDLLGTLGACSGCGHSLRFWAKIVAIMPDDLVRDLIAHELAHVYQWARGWDLDIVGNCKAEEDARRNVECWGFSSTAFFEWKRSNGINKAIDLDKLSPCQLKRH